MRPMRRLIVEERTTIIIILLEERFGVVLLLCMCDSIVSVSFELIGQSDSGST